MATYTYRNGTRVNLEKSDTDFVVRALPAKLARFRDAPQKQVSSASTRVTVAHDHLEAAMAEARTMAPTHHAYKTAKTGDDFNITDRIIVRFKTGTTSAQIDALAGKYGLVLLRAYSETDFLFQLTNHTNQNPVKLVVQLTEQESQLVQLVDHDLNHVVTRSAIRLPTDNGYRRQWHLHQSVSNPQFDPNASSGCEEAWRLLDGFGSKDVVVGITDDGCKLDHVDFNGPDKFANWAYFEGINLISRDMISAQPARMFELDNDHGTSCAGVCAAEIDGRLTVGAAPGVRLLPIKWEVTSDGFLAISDSKLRAAIDFCSSTVDILSNSWGAANGGGLASFLTVDRIRDLATNGGRRGKGILFLWAAGNENRPIHHSGVTPVPWTNGWQFNSNGTRTWRGVESKTSFENLLVDIPGVMHVAALASNAQRSHYSNYGTGISICAPSSNSHAFLRMTVPGLGVTTTAGNSTTTTTSEFGGTSSATPLTAGIAALVISANPELTATEIEAILKRTARKTLNFEGYPKTPPLAGVDPNPSWDVSPIAPFDSGSFVDNGLPEGSWSPWFGHGNVDAAAAVKAALSLVVAAVAPADGPANETPKKKPPTKTAATKKARVKAGA